MLKSSAIFAGSALATHIEKNNIALLRSTLCERLLTRAASE